MTADYLSKPPQDLDVKAEEYRRVPEEAGSEPANPRSPLPPSVIRAATAGAFNLVLDVSLSPSDPALVRAVERYVRLYASVAPISGVDLFATETDDEAERPYLLKVITDGTADSVLADTVAAGLKALLRSPEFAPVVSMLRRVKRLASMLGAGGLGLLRGLIGG